MLARLSAAAVSGVDAIPVSVEVDVSSGLPGLLIYVMVDSIDATVNSIVAAGGKIVQPVGGDAPEITARFSDPAGNVLGLYQPRHQ